MKIALVSALAIVAVATPAAAQDAGTFSGLRVEVLGGLDKVELSVDEDVFGSDESGSSEGVVYGVGVGYDFDLGRAVVGLEAEYADSTTDYGFAAAGEIEGYDFDGSLTMDAAKDIYVGARVGAKAGSLLFYAKGGYSMASADITVRGSIDGETGSADADLDLSGFRIGAGAEAQINANTFVKLEYRYSAYSDGELEIDGTTLDGKEAFDYIDLDRHQVVFGVGYRF